MQEPYRSSEWAKFGTIFGKIRNYDFRQNQHLALDNDQLWPCIGQNQVWRKRTLAKFTICGQIDKN